ncbi:MAG: acyl carrier protein [Lachnospiraceae bacterium]|nr:acyl carrier protein [Lachnospiraceae bacterium]
MEELLEILGELHPDVDFENETQLVDDGILDSLDIVSLIGEIKRVFDVTVTAGDIIPDNFNTVQAMMALIERLEEEA